MWCSRERGRCWSKSVVVGVVEELRPGLVASDVAAGEIGGQLEEARSEWVPIFFVRFYLLGRVVAEYEATVHLFHLCLPQFPAGVFCGVSALIPPPFPHIA